MKALVLVMAMFLMIGCAGVGVWKDSVREKYSSVRDKYSDVKAQVSPFLNGTSLEPWAQRAALVLEAADAVIVATDRIADGECGDPEVEAVVPNACSRVAEVFELVEEATATIEGVLEELENMEE